MPRGGDAQASKTSGSRGSPAVAPPPAHPHPRSLHPSLIGRGERPLGFLQAPGQPPPRPQPGPASSIKGGFNCTNKCLPGSFFFLKQRRAACQNPQIQKCASQPFPCRPRRQGRPSRMIPSPLGAQGTGLGTHSRGWVDAPSGGLQGPAPHSSWPMRWALTRVQTRGLVVQLHPTCHCEGDFLPPTGQPLTLRSDISTLVPVGGREPNKQGMNLKKQQRPAPREDSGHPHQEPA